MEERTMPDIDTTDAGLEELTSDILGSADATTETQSQPSEPTETPQEPTESQAQAEQSAQAPTAQPAQAEPTQAEPTIDIDGQQYRVADLKAALQTAKQFPHLQGLYGQLKQRLEQHEQNLAQQPTQGPAQPDPKHVLASIRSSFDQSVKESVAQGFIEEDFAALYPNLSASLVMNRDALTAVSRIVQQQAEKIAAYERQINSERVVLGIRNSMTALSGQHEALRPLADPSVQQEFLGYLYDLNPQVGLLQDPDFLIRQWVAFKKDTYLGQADAQRQQAQKQVAARVDAKRRASGDALTGSRPPNVAPQPRTPLDDLVDSEFDRRSGR